MRCIMIPTRTLTPACVSRPGLQTQSDFTLFPVVAVDALPGHAFSTPDAHQYPMSQTTHGPPAGPKYPSEHRQSNSDVLPSPDVEAPAVQSEHATSPTVGLNSPTPHAATAPVALLRVTPLLSSRGGGAAGLAGEQCANAAVGREEEGGRATERNRRVEREWEEAFKS
eukprot:3920489-Rhodomonas_salina.3